MCRWSRLRPPELDPLAGFEPTTSRFVAGRTSSRAAESWLHGQDLHLRSAAYETAALLLSYRALAQRDGFEPTSPGLQPDANPPQLSLHFLGCMFGAGTRYRTRFTGLLNRCITFYALPAWCGVRDSHPNLQHGTLTCYCYTNSACLVAPPGFAPGFRDYQSRVLLLELQRIGRGGRIRTCGFPLPMRSVCLADIHPDIWGELPDLHRYLSPSQGEALLTKLNSPKTWDFPLKGFPVDNDDQRLTPDQRYLSLWYARKDSNLQYNSF